MLILVQKMVTDAREGQQEMGSWLLECVIGLSMTCVDTNSALCH